MASNSTPKSDSSDSTDQRGSNNPRLKRAAEREAAAARKADAARQTGAARKADAARQAGAPRARSASRVSIDDTTQLTSVRIGDIDLDNRKSGRRNRRVRWPYILVGCIAAVIVIIAIALIVISRTSVLEIKDIEIEGNDHLTLEEVSALVTVPQGTNMLDVDEEGIKTSLKRDAWIQDVTVTRKLPSTLSITITERQIVAVVEVPIELGQDVQSWAISSDGMWLMPIPAQESEIGQGISEQIYEDAANVLWITDVPYGVTPTIGTYCTDENVNNALAIVSGMTTELKDQVKLVSATDAESTLLTLDSGIEIAFGVAENIRDKERICLEIIKENPTVVYINVRVVDRPTWRSA